MASRAWDIDRSSGDQDEGDGDTGNQITEGPLVVRGQPVDEGEVVAGPGPARFEGLLGPVLGADDGDALTESGIVVVADDLPSLIMAAIRNGVWTMIWTDWIRRPCR